MTYDGYQVPSILATPGAKKLAVEFTTMSKGYNMAGWRVGFCAGNAEMIRALGTIKAYYDYGMFRPIQIAAIMALRHGDADVEAQSAEYQRRRDVLVEGLAANRLGSESAAGEHVSVGQNSRPVVWQAEFAGICHQAVGRGKRGGQPRQRLRPGRRRLSADGADRKRKSAPPSSAANRPMPGSSGPRVTGPGNGQGRRAPPASADRAIREVGLWPTTAPYSVS